MMKNSWTKVKGGAQYANVSERTFRDWPKQGLKHSRLPTGTILTKYQWIDEFLENFAVNENEVDKIVADVMRGMK